MATISTMNSPELSKAIKERRQELDLSITKAAAKAGISIKTWTRYEAGESIRADKVKNVLKALNWKSFPRADDQQLHSSKYDIEKFKKSHGWSKFLEKNFNQYIAASFVIGSENLRDEIEEDLRDLSGMPRGTHVGQLPMSWMEIYLPKLFLTRYDYEFLFNMKSALAALVQRARSTPETGDFRAHTVVEEILLLTISKEAETMMKDWENEMDAEGISYMTDIFSVVDDICDDEEHLKYPYYGYLPTWVFELFDDDDISWCLYNDGEFTDEFRNEYVTEDHIYHFSHWFEEQFYLPSDEDAEL